MEVKHFRTYNEQIAYLEQHGLIVDDVNILKHYLEYYNYYRLSAYWFPFAQDRNAGNLKVFTPGTHSSQIIQIFDFDESLRNVCLKILSKIESAFRSLIGHEIGRVDPLAYLDISKLNESARYDTIIRSKHSDWLQYYQANLYKSRNEECVKHHHEQYDGKIPIWAAVEIMDWGTLSRLFSLCDKKIRIQITKHFHQFVYYQDLKTWLISLNVLRNLCAHSARLWNRKLPMQPRIQNKQSELYAIRNSHADHTKIFTILSVAQFLIIQIDPTLKHELPELISNFPQESKLYLGSMGFPDNWQNFDLWKTS